MRFWDLQELEQEEYARKGVTLTPDLWLMKLMVGAVDPTFDEQARNCCLNVVDAPFLPS